MSSSNSRIPERGNSQTAPNEMRQSQFVDTYADFQMPLHFDQYNPATWPEEYRKKQLERSVHPHMQQPPNPNQTYGGARAPGLTHHGGREITLPVSGPSRGNESLTSVHYRPPASQIYNPVIKPQRARDSEDEVDEDSAIKWLLAVGYIIVPQNTFVGLSGGPIIPSIDFTPKSKKSYRELGIDKDTARATHSIRNSEDKVFSQVPGVDTILIKILWPGYPARPYEGRINNARNLTRGELLDLVCKVVIEFACALKASRICVLKGYAEWMIGLGSRGMKMHKFYISRLYHLGGNYFQPEIWARRAPTGKH